MAVAFLHSYANPDHEQAMLAVLRDVAPDVEVSLSSDLSREYREYERTSTAVLDAYTKPIIRTYLRVLQDRLDEGGFDGQFLMMRSGGGAMTAALAQDQPVNLILSGPAGGVVGAAGFAAITGEPNLVTVDMGGTSLDASLVVDGQPVLHQGAEFEGLPINTSSLYIHTIGAGGGSIAWLDEAGGLQVGPQSAGAVPGPASYGAGGEQPTFTDAALVMGYLGEETPLGETLTLRRDLATTALEPIAGELGMTVPELARGIVRISTTKITGAVRSITVELGRDPKDFALLAFGGAGGIVAVDVARELGMSKVIIPPGQGAFSAVGMLMADVQHDTSRDRPEQPRRVGGGHGRQVLVRDGRRGQRRPGRPGLRTRPAGLHVRRRCPLLGPGAHRHRPRAGRRRGPGSARRRTVRAAPPPALRPHAGGPDRGHDVPAQRRRGRRQAAIAARRATHERRARADGDAFDGDRRRRRCRRACTSASDCSRGDALDGPAVIVEHTATTVIHRGDRLRVGDHGELTITLGGVS